MTIDMTIETDYRSRFIPLSIIDSDSTTINSNTSSHLTTPLFPFKYPTTATAVSGDATSGYANAYRSYLEADVVKLSVLRTVTGEKISIVRDLIGVEAFNQGMMSTLGRTF